MDEKKTAMSQFATMADYKAAVGEHPAVPAGTGSQHSSDDAACALDEQDHDWKLVHVSSLRGMSLPAGWVPLHITFDGEQPEEVAYGPQRMMDRLKKWLDKYYAYVIAEKNAGSIEKRAECDHGALIGLIRRLYVELYHCHQQMITTTDENDEPMWLAGVTVPAVLADAKSVFELAGRCRAQGGDTSAESSPLAPVGAVVPAPQTATTGWQSMESAPTDGTEILIRYPLQANVKQLAHFNQIHRIWFSKGEAISPSAQKCEWVALPPDAAPPAAGVDQTDRFDFRAHLARQAAFSLKTFGPGMRTIGVTDHIRKELAEIAAKPDDLMEWIDVVILALDGAWRCGGSADQIINAIIAKQTKNEGRNWPDWRTADPNKAIEHDRSGESQVAAPTQQGEKS